MQFNPHIKLTTFKVTEVFSGIKDTQKFAIIRIHVNVIMFIPPTTADRLAANVAATPYERLFMLS
jgi:hypothetical protein